MDLTYTLITDGSSDRVLIPIINWALDQIDGVRYASQHAEITLRPSAGLLLRAESAIKYYECDVLFVHRDAESLSIKSRIEEIQNQLVKLNKPYIPVVPIRMTEAWLLVDEQAIRSAASNPNGKVKLNLPEVNSLEGLADPKSVLFENLKLASELPSGRLRKFRPEVCRHRVAELISDFSQLRNLSAFVHFENSLIESIQALAGSAL
ncbi:MAG: hypothetical protein WAQ56_03070 [Candidatus Nitrotoga sp.]